MTYTINGHTVRLLLTGHSNPLRTDLRWFLYVSAIPVTECKLVKRETTAAEVRR